MSEEGSKDVVERFLNERRRDRSEKFTMLEARVYYLEGQVDELQDALAFLVNTEAAKSKKG